MIYVFFAIILCAIAVVVVAAFVASIILKIKNRKIQNKS